MFSLRFLLAAIAFAGLACAALVNRTPLWGNAIVTMTIAVGVGATIALWRSLRMRAFYAPLAGVVWIYLVVIFCSLFDDLERNLITSGAAVHAWTRMSGKPNIDAERWEYYLTTVSHYSPAQIQPDTWRLLVEFRSFYYTVHCCSAVVFGALAGMMTAWACRERATREASCN